DLALSILEEAYQKVTPLYGFRPADQVPVVLYPNEVFSKLEGRAWWAQGMFDGKVRGGCNGATNHPRDFRDLLSHEYGHAVLHRARRGSVVPGWFDEGLAQVAEGTMDPTVELTCLFGHGARLQDLRGGFARLPGDQNQVHEAYQTALHAAERLIAWKGSG